MITLIVYVFIVSTADPGHTSQLVTTVVLPVLSYRGHRSGDPTDKHGQTKVSSDLHKAILALVLLNVITLKPVDKLKPETAICKIVKDSGKKLTTNFMFYY